MACGNIVSPSNKIQKFEPTQRSAERSSQPGLVSLTIVLHLFQLHSGSTHSPSCQRTALQ